MSVVLVLVLVLILVLVLVLLLVLVVSWAIAFPRYGFVGGSTIRSDQSIC